ncbi:MAG: DUF1566 domain-containing protein [Pseudomonadota bacterium]
MMNSIQTQRCSHWIRKLLTAALVLLPLIAQAQCPGGVENAAIEAATPSDDFRPQADGTVQHFNTRLVWQRCALGQTWDGTTCMGSPLLLDWESALVAARDHVQAGSSDWRVPNRNELTSIIESRCHSPAINGEIFPATPQEWFWSNSPLTGQVDQVWVVLFTDGELQAASVNGLYAVRLVRAGRN